MHTEQRAVVGQYRTQIHRKIEWQQMQLWLLLIAAAVIIAGSGYLYWAHSEALTGELLIAGIAVVIVVSVLLFSLAQQTRYVTQLLLREDELAQLRYDLIAVQEEALGTVLSRHIPGYRRTLNHLSVLEECAAHTNRINERTVQFMAQTQAAFPDRELADAIRGLVQASLAAEGVEATTDNVVAFIERNSKSAPAE